MPIPKPQPEPIVTDPIYLVPGHSVLLATGGKFSQISGLPKMITEKLVDTTPNNPYGGDVYELILAASKEQPFGTFTLTYSVTPAESDFDPRPAGWKGAWLPKPEPAYFQTTLTVGPVRQPPIAKFTVTPGNGILIFDASSSKSSSTTCPIISYEWNFGDNFTAKSPTPQVGHNYLEASTNYSKADTYHVTLTCIDMQGYHGNHSEDLTIGPIALIKPPTVNGYDVTFDASDSQDLYFTIVSYDWDFGDLTDPTDPACHGKNPPIHHYAEGTYEVTLTCRDVAGTVGFQSIEVLATEP